MSRTDLDPVVLARSLRTKAGDGSMEWVCEPMQVSVLLDAADMLEENAKLRELCEWAVVEIRVNGNVSDASTEMLFDEMRELGIEVD